MSDELRDSVMYEVWRSHRNAAPDVKLMSGGLTWAREYLAECQADGLLDGFCTFYIVKATTTRERVA